MNDNAENIFINLPKLKWACRRGLLELDVLLGNFIEKGYISLSIDKKLAFVELLECQDPELYDWLIRDENPSEAKFIPIIKAIKSYARIQFPIKTV